MGEHSGGQTEWSPKGSTAPLNSLTQPVGATGIPKHDWRKHLRSTTSSQSCEPRQLRQIIGEPAFVTSDGTNLPSTLLYGQWRVPLIRPLLSTRLIVQSSVTLFVRCPDLHLAVYRALYLRSGGYAPSNGKT